MANLTITVEVAEAQVRDFARLPLVRVDEAMILAAIERSRSMRDPKPAAGRSEGGAW